MLQTELTPSTPLCCDPVDLITKLKYPCLIPQDSNQFTTFTTKDGLGDNMVNAIHQDKNGVLWFGTRDGVSRYNGEKFGAGTEMVVRFKLATG